MNKIVTALGPNDPDDGDQGRQMRGIAIAALTLIKPNSDGYSVPSQSGRGAYVVNLETGPYHGPYCTCPDFEERQLPCKHIWAVQITLEREEEPDGIEDVQTIRVQYGQHWPSYNAAQENEEEHFEQLLRNLCDMLPQPQREPGKPGRPSLLLPDVVYGLGLKVYAMKSARRAMSLLRRAEDEGLMTKSPSRASAIRYLAEPDLTPVLRGLIEQSALPLRAIETDFAVDSSGFSGTSNNRWFDHKHGTAKKRVKWAKLHLICGVRTNIVTAADCTATESADVRFFDELVRITARNFDVREVSADKAYLSKANVRMVNEIGGTPFIPPKSNTTITQKDPKQRDDLWNKMMLHFTLQQDDFLRHYHKRSNVETTFYMIKSKFGGETLLSKSGPAQVNETLMRVLCHNICVVIKAMYQLGIGPNFIPRGILSQESAADSKYLLAEGF